MNDYLALATALKDDLQKAKGLIKAERFSSLVNEGKLLSLSIWENEEAVSQWRNQAEHRASQRRGHELLFEKYTITVASAIRAYTEIDRLETPADSNIFLQFQEKGAGS